MGTSSLCVRHEADGLSVGATLGLVSPAGEPRDPAAIAVPAVVSELAAGRSIVPVWCNEIGGVTFDLGGGEEFVKWGPPHPEFDPRAEAVRLDWAGAWVLVPRVLGVGSDADQNRWLYTCGLPGTSAVSGRWPTQPAIVVPELGRALRLLHDRLPVDRCRWTWSVEQRTAGRPGPGPGPEPLDLVVCHGDACNPNFLLGQDARCVGYVDLGSLGVADRWADLAPALLSLGWNFGEGWAGAFLAGYGIELDPVKLAFYTDLWEST